MRKVWGDLEAHVVPTRFKFNQQRVFMQVLGTGRYVITKKLVKTLIGQTWQGSTFPCVESGANNPFEIIAPHGFVSEDKMKALS